MPRERHLLVAKRRRFPLIGFHLRPLDASDWVVRDRIGLAHIVIDLSQRGQLAPDSGAGQVVFSRSAR